MSVGEVTGAIDRAMKEVTLPKFGSKLLNGCGKIYCQVREYMRMEEATGARQGHKGGELKDTSQILVKNISIKYGCGRVFREKSEKEEKAGTNDLPLAGTRFPIQCFLGLL